MVILKVCRHQLNAIPKRVAPCRVPRLDATSRLPGSGPTTEAPLQRCRCDFGCYLNIPRDPNTVPKLKGSGTEVEFTMKTVFGCCLTLDLPNIRMVIFHIYVKLPEGIMDYHNLYEFISIDKKCDFTCFKMRKSGIMGYFCGIY